MSDAKSPKAASSKRSHGSSRLRHLPLFSRSSKKTEAPPTFDPQHILPKDDLPPRSQTPGGDQDALQLGDPTSPQPVFGAPQEEAKPMSAGRSASPPSVFDEHAPPPDTEPTTAQPSASASEQQGSYDLKPPPPSVPHDNVEALAARLFSADHLDLILRDHTLSSRLTRFLDEYRPEISKNLKRYVETKKAITAVDYANSVAQNMATLEGREVLPAATLDTNFAAQSKRIVEELVEDALPAYVTYRLVLLVTDTLVKEITGNNAPIMRELIPSLAEVYCVTDPSLPDNPIVYASEEFYNATQYGRDYVIGRNCRFLQGPNSVDSTVRRLIEAITAGQEVCETILNYRRDGSPFMNLLMIAPLCDNQGHVRYFLGCQIDVSSLVEGGRGLESFSQLLSQDQSDSRFGGRDHDPASLLGGLGQMLGEDESNVVRDRTMTSNAGSTQALSNKGPRARRVIGMEDPGADRAMFASSQLGPSGRLPGVYQNFLLIRPYPSLRITFTSPALRIPGLLQTKFLDRIGGPAHVREGILDALSHGTGVTARVSWLTNPCPQADSQSSTSATSDGGKPRWVHCTPLLGSDDRVGVWMIVMVEREEVTGRLNRLDWAGQHAGLGSPVTLGAASQRYAGNDKLYAEYKKREGEGRPSSQPATASSVRERRDAEDHFKDF